MKSANRLAACFALSAVACIGMAGTAYADKIGWSQRPDMNAGTDTLSMHRTFGPVVVDDFIVDKPTILGYRWWGSYFAAAGQSRGNPRQVVFELSYHDDCAANAPISAQCPGDLRTPGGPTPYVYSTPGQPYRFQILTAQETFFGTTAAGEDVYEYFVMLPQPWAHTPGAIGWLDVAWNAGQFGTDPLADIWGWHESFQHNLDRAVQTDSAANRQLPLGGNPHLGPWNMLQGKDMAFEVITVPEPGVIALLGLGFAAFGFARRRKS